MNEEWECKRVLAMKKPVRDDKEENRRTQDATCKRRKMEPRENFLGG